MATPPFENNFPGILSGRRDVPGEHACHIWRIEVCDLEILEILAFKPVIYKVTWPYPHRIFEKIFRGHDGIFPGSKLAKFEVRFFSHLGAIRIWRPKFTGSPDSSHAPCSKIFWGIMSGLYLGACVPNFKFTSLVILELLALNAKNSKGSRDPGHALFSKKCRGHN